MEICKHCGGRIMKVLVEASPSTSDEVWEWTHVDNNLSIECPNAPVAEPIDTSATQEGDLFTDRQKVKLHQLVNQL